MPSIKTYSYTNEQLEETLTKGKNVMVSAMLKNGDITPEAARKYDLKYALLVREMSLFSTWWNKHVKKENNSTYIIAVEQHSFDPEDYDKTSPDQEEENNE